MERETALKRFKGITAVLALLCTILLLCSGLGIRYYDDDIYGPPYYLGGFIVGIPAFFAGLVCLSILAKAVGRDANDVRLNSLAPRISCMYTVTLVLLPVCVVGTLLTVLGSFTGSEDERPKGTNKFLATVILIGCIFTFCVILAAMCTVCVYGKYFGVVIKRGRRTILIVDSSTLPTSDGGASVSVQNNVNVFTTNVNNQHVGQLEVQNRLLEHQLYLQQQMMKQQQQQQREQTQFSGGTYPPPPSYNGSDPAYPPTAPPPPYSKDY